jgi:glyoxylase-like metal-dependent hydrolase (beta-lactamase superfamily II)
MAVIFRQFFEPISSTYTYLLADGVTREALLLDSVQETMDRDLQIIQEMKLDLKILLETHIHADHITASGPIRKKTGALIYAGAGTQLATADRLLADGEIFQVGALSLQALATPGHTDGCTCFYMAPYLFSGDTLMIRGCGRTDFQQGSSEQLFHSVHDKLFVLPHDTLVYPGHDYKGRTCSSIGEEKECNPRLKSSNDLSTFVNIMNNLNLDRPQKIDVAVPANRQSGLPQ